MRYPYIAYSSEIEVHPIFRGLEGDPLIVDMSTSSSIFDNMDVRDQKELQRRIDQMMAGKFTWGVSSYLENRERILSQCPQMVEEQRFYHLGLDIIVPLGTPLHSPLNATVAHSGYEEGPGNYGGHVMLVHESSKFETFYSFYGHLNRQTLPEKGKKIPAGGLFAYIGDFHENGDWFYHTHLQVLTEKAVALGYISKGYCAAEDLTIMNTLCPSPLSLFML